MPNSPCLVTLSTRGYVKRLSPDTFEAQRRGGKGAGLLGGAAEWFGKGGWALGFEGDGGV